MQLSRNADLGGGENQFEVTLSKALGISGERAKDPLMASKLNKVCFHCILEVTPINLTVYYFKFF